MVKGNRRVRALTAAGAGVVLLSPAARAAPPTTSLASSTTRSHSLGAATPDDASDDFTGTERHVGQFTLTLKDRDSDPTGQRDRHDLVR